MFKEVRERERERDIDFCTWGRLFFVGYCGDGRAYNRLPGLLFDMWVLTRVDYFLGAYTSTLTNTICEWRGRERMLKSNICFLRERMEKLYGKSSMHIERPFSVP